MYIYTYIYNMCIYIHTYTYIYKTHWSQDAQPPPQAAAAPEASAAADSSLLQQILKIQSLLMCCVKWLRSRLLRIPHISFSSDLTFENSQRLQMHYHLRKFSKVRSLLNEMCKMTWSRLLRIFNSRRCIISARNSEESAHDEFAVSNNLFEISKSRKCISQQEIVKSQIYSHVAW